MYAIIAWLMYSRAYAEPETEQRGWLYALTRLVAAVARIKSG